LNIVAILNLLQWGRARAGAELYNNRMFMFDVFRLQWGRARAGAEFFRFFSTSDIRLLLQWGRARAGAEFRSTPPAAARPGCFNGAAPARARSSITKRFSRSSFGGFNGAAPARARSLSDFVT